MESQQKTVFGVMDGADHRSVKRWSNRDLFLRGLALLLTLAAALLLGLNKQTAVVPLKIVDSLPAINISVVAKWRYLSAFVYFVVSNAVACSYAAASLLLSLSGKKGPTPILIIVDLLMVALLSSSNGATAAIGVIGYEGNSHVRWNKVCNVFGRFCNQSAAAISLSLLGSLAFLLMVLLAALHLHKNSRK